MKKMGFVKIDRSLFEHKIWLAKPFSPGQAWIDLIGLANHKDVKQFSGDQVKVFERGTVNRSVVSLADRWGWGRKKTNNFLKALESDQMIVQKSTKKGTTITIVNYGKYQNREQRKEQQRNNRGTSEEHLGNINKNDKRMIKNEKEKTFPVTEYGFDPSEEMTPEQLQIYLDWKKDHDGDL